MTADRDQDDPGHQRFVDDFAGVDLDLGVGPVLPPPVEHPAASAATYAVRDACLHLTIPVEQGPWCPDEHDPLRVSGVRSGVFAGPAGGAVGQQPVREGAVVREAREPLWGWTPRFGRLECRTSLARRRVAQQPVTQGLSRGRRGCAAAAPRHTPPAVPGAAGQRAA